MPKSREATVSKVEELFDEIACMWADDITHDDVKELAQNLKEDVLYWLGADNANTD